MTSEQAIAYGIIWFVIGLTGLVTTWFTNLIAPDNRKNPDVYRFFALFHLGLAVMCTVGWLTSLFKPESIWSQGWFPEYLVWLNAGAIVAHMFLYHHSAQPSHSEESCHTKKASKPS